MPMYEQVEALKTFWPACLPSTKGSNPLPMTIFVSSELLYYYCIITSLENKSLSLKSTIILQHQQSIFLEFFSLHDDIIKFK